MSLFLEDTALAGDLRAAPTVTPAAAYPHGATVDFVATRGPHHLQLRVHERGVGETRACGTGARAAVVAARAHQPSPPLAVDYTADLPGGRLHIVVRPSGAIDLTGPAVITAQGTRSLTTGSWLLMPTGQRGYISPRGSALRTPPDPDSATPASCPTHYGTSTRPAPPDVDRSRVPMARARTVGTGERWGAAFPPFLLVPHRLTPRAEQSSSLLAVNKCGSHRERGGIGRRNCGADPIFPGAMGMRAAKRRGG
ncbi:hypothetical protein [Streptomyces sp. Mo3]|uniref:hypothetical protein n=1 Tax=Streptomyces sp. Mo3 TaxID=3161190 RepID=UPI0013C40D28